jgi:hypothetical protein
MPEGFFIYAFAQFIATIFLKHFPGAIISVIRAADPPHYYFSSHC